MLNAYLGVDKYFFDVFITFYNIFNLNYFHITHFITFNLNHFDSAYFIMIEIKLPRYYF